MKKLAIFLTIFMVMTLSACNGGNGADTSGTDDKTAMNGTNSSLSEESNKDYYISISCTTYKDKENPSDGSINHVVYYEPKSGSLRDMPFEDTFDGHLTNAVYSKSEDKIYYSNRGETDDIYSFDIKTGQKEKVFKGMVYVPQIVLKGDNLYSVVVKKSTSPLEEPCRILKYNKKTGDTIYSKRLDKGMSVEAIGVGLDDEDGIWASAYPLNEHEEKRVGRYELVKYDKNLNRIDEIKGLDQYILALSYGGKNLILCPDTHNTAERANIVKVVDLKTKKLRDMEIKGATICYDAALTPDGRGIYFLGSEVEYNKVVPEVGVYYYDFEREELDCIYYETTYELDMDYVTLINSFQLIVE